MLSFSFATLPFVVSVRGGEVSFCLPFAGLGRAHPPLTRTRRAGPGPRVAGLWGQPGALVLRWKPTCPAKTQGSRSLARKSANSQRCGRRAMCPVSRRVRAPVARVWRRGAFSPPLPSQAARDAASAAIMSETDPRINQYSPPNGEPSMVAKIAALGLHFSLYIVFMFSTRAVHRLQN